MQRPKALLAVVLSAGVVDACDRGPRAAFPPPASWRASSTSGRINGVFAPRTGRVEVGGFHAWTLRLEWSDGQPVFPAQIGVNGGMPEHGHGLPSQPVVTEYLGDGKYLVEGVSFNMMGKWRVLFEVTATEHKDRLQFELLLDW